MPDNGARIYVPGAAPEVSVKTQIGGDFAPLGAGGLALPTTKTEIDAPDLPYVLRLTVAVVHGKPVCIGLAAEMRRDGMPVTRRGLNSLPVDRLVRTIAANSAVATGSGPGYVTYDFPAGPDQVAAARREIEPRRGRRAHPDEHLRLLRKVVDAYRDLIRAGCRKPKPFIATELCISQSYVRRLLTEARQIGMLGPAIPGRAGEADAQDADGAE
jgi:hypothetical protein